MVRRTTVKVKNLDESIVKEVIRLYITENFTIEKISEVFGYSRPAIKEFWIIIIYQLKIRKK